MHDVQLYCFLFPVDFFGTQMFAGRNDLQVETKRSVKVLCYVIPFYPQPNHSDLIRNQRWRAAKGMQH
jgi:hypothetical protein